MLVQSGSRNYIKSTFYNPVPVLDFVFSPKKLIHAKLKYYYDSRNLYTQKFSMF